VLSRDTSKLSAADLDELDEAVELALLAVEEPEPEPDPVFDPECEVEAVVPPALAVVTDVQIPNPVSVAVTDGMKDAQTGFALAEASKLDKAALMLLMIGPLTLYQE